MKTSIRNIEFISKCDSSKSEAYAYTSVKMFITVVCVLFLIRLRHGFRQINFPCGLLFWLKIRIFSLSIFLLKR